MSDANREAESGKFISYPNDCIVGIVDDDAQAAEVRRLLAEAGLDASTSVLRGPAAADEIDASGAHHGLIARIVRLVQFTTMDGEQSQRYEDEARQGHSVFIVHLDEHENIEKVRAVLKDHGGHFINWYGRLHFETLEP